MTGMGYVSRKTPIVSNRTRARGGDVRWNSPCSTPVSPQRFWPRRSGGRRKGTGRGSLSMDPLGFVDGVNLFVYAHSMPMALNDPSGLGCKLCLSNGELIDTIMESDDPDEIAACVYKFRIRSGPHRTGAGMTREQEKCGCVGIDDCGELFGGLAIENVEIIRAHGPVRRRFSFRYHCPQTTEGKCFAITAHECKKGFDQSLQDCLDACDEGGDDQELICKGWPKHLKKLCKIAAEEGEEQCRIFCRISRSDWKEIQ